MLEAIFRAGDHPKPLHGHTVSATIPREAFITITGEVYVTYSEAVYVTIYRASDHENYPAYYATTG